MGDIDYREGKEICMPEKNIELTKIYHFPDNIAIVKYADVNLIIFTEGCNWLVLSDRECEIFKILLTDSGSRDT